MGAGTIGPSADIGPSGTLAGVPWLGCPWGGLAGYPGCGKSVTGSCQSLPSFQSPCVDNRGRGGLA